LTQVIDSVMLPARNKIVYRGDPDDEDCVGSALRFRLFYSGPLLASQGGGRTGQPEHRPEHKHALRKAFHKQLKGLWETDRFLRETRIIKSRVDYDPQRLIGDANGWPSRADVTVPMSEWVADQYRENGYRFIPLVRNEFALSCRLDVLFLRIGDGHSVFTAGDVDNRIKTLIDALCKPLSGAALRGNEVPGEGEDPFYYLLEDDKLITGFGVETDRLLGYPESTEEERRLAKIIIDIDIRPRVITKIGAGFL
jgi:hypothetical protein